MNRNCSQCSDYFKESSTKYWARLANNSPILCNPCFRILHADKRENVRKSHIIRNENVRKSNTIENGPLVLMRKEKLSYDEAIDVIEKYKHEKNG